MNRCAVRPALLTAHRADAVLVTEAHGRISNKMHGFNFRQTRFLSRFEFKIEDAIPFFVSANAVDHHSTTAYHSAPSPAARAAEPTPQDDSNSGGEIVQKGIELQINAFCSRGLWLDITVTNHALAETTVTLLLELGTDFADLNKAQAGKRQQQAPIERRWTASEGDEKAHSAGEREYRYGNPELKLATRIRLSGANGLTHLGDAVACRFDLRPHDPRLMSEVRAWQK